jgi:hypothetical protein
MISDSQMQNEILQNVPEGHPDAIWKQLSAIRTQIDGKLKSFRAFFKTSW